MSNVGGVPFPSGIGPPLDLARTRVVAPEQEPYRKIAHLDIEWPSGPNTHGTGFFAGPRCVLTAGHCVHDLARGGWTRGVRVVPGRNGVDGKYYGEAVSTGLRSVESWVTHQDAAYDYGAIFVGPRDPAEDVGYFAPLVLDDATAMSQQVLLAGYPLDANPPKTMWRVLSSIDHVEPRRLRAPCVLSTGMSGAPMLARPTANEAVVVGIVTNQSGGFVTGVRVTSGMLATIMEWRIASESVLG